MGPERRDDEHAEGGRYTERSSGEDPADDEVTRDEDDERVDTPAGREQGDRERP
jgi:hypothetical protein